MKTLKYCRYINGYILFILESGVIYDQSYVIYRVQLPKTDHTWNKPILSVLRGVEFWKF